MTSTIKVEGIGAQQKRPGSWTRSPLGGGSNSRPGSRRQQLQQQLTSSQLRLHRIVTRNRDQLNDIVKQQQKQTASRQPERTGVSRTATESPLVKRPFKQQQQKQQLFTLRGETSSSPPLNQSHRNNRGENEPSKRV